MGDLILLAEPFFLTNFVELFSNIPIEIDSGVKLLCHFESISMVHDYLHVYNVHVV